MKRIFCISLKILIAFAVLISASVKYTTYTEASEKHSPVNTKKHQYMHMSHQMMGHKMPCHNEGISVEECFKHCLEIASQPYVLSSINLRFDNQIKDIIKLFHSLSHHINTVASHQMMPTGPPANKRQTYRSSGTQNITALNQRLRI